MLQPATEQKYYVQVLGFDEYFRFGEYAGMKKFCSDLFVSLLKSEYE